MEKLLAAGAKNLDAAINSGYTALMLASREGYFEIVEKLIDARANLDAVAKDGATALILAHQKGFLKIAEKLIAAGALQRI